MQAEARVGFPSATVGVQSASVAETDALDQRVQRWDTAGPAARRGGSGNNPGRYTGE